MLDNSKMAALVASKVCHDIVGPMSMVMQGVEMLREADASGRNAEALGLIEQCVTKAFAKLDFYRQAVADGLGSEGEASISETRTTAERFFQSAKPTLEWAVSGIAPRPGLKVMLHLMALAADCLPKGGTVRVEGEQTTEYGEIRVIATGPRAKLKAETALCLAGEAPQDGFQPYNIVPTLTGLLARQSGIILRAREAEERVELVMQSPAIRIAQD
jgi:histidine phosphotransferase ChpT